MHKGQHLGKIQKGFTIRCLLIREQQVELMVCLSGSKVTEQSLNASQQNPCSGNIGRGHGELCISHDKLLLFIMFILMLIHKMVLTASRISNFFLALRTLIYRERRWKEVCSKGRAKRECCLSVTLQCLGYYLCFLSNKTPSSGHCTFQLWLVLCNMEREKINN